MLMFMMMMIWDDVVVYDNVCVRWCWYWWWYWDEMMLMMIMTLKWDNVDVDDIIVMMYDVYVHVHGGCSDQVRCPWWGK